jgi:hypothetical protein
MKTQKLEASQYLTSNYRSTVKQKQNKTRMILAQKYTHRQIEWNRKLRNKPKKVLPLDKDTKNIQWKKDLLFKKWYWEN